MLYLRMGEQDNNDKTSNQDYEEAMRVLGGGKHSDLSGNLSSANSDVKGMTHEQRSAELFVNTSIAVGAIGADVIDSHLSGHLANAPLTDLNGTELAAGEDPDAIQHLNVDDLSGGLGGGGDDGGLGPTGGV